MHTFDGAKFLPLNIDLHEEHIAIRHYLVQRHHRDLVPRAVFLRRVRLLDDIPVRKEVRRSVLEQQ